MATPVLNWKELALLVGKIRPDATGLFVDRIIVADRPRHLGGYLKDEWVIRLTSRAGERYLVFSIRPRSPYLYLAQGKGPKVAAEGTHSPFSMALSKHLRGKRITGIEALPRERIVIIEFENLGLVLTLIPALPEALLISREGDAAWILESSRPDRPGRERGARFTPPGESKAPDALAVREAILASSQDYAKAVEAALDTEAFQSRLTQASRELKRMAQEASERIRKNELTLREAEAEPDWQRYGDLLKSVLSNPPSIHAGKRSVVDYASGKEVEIPSDPKLSPKAQVQKYYHQARRRNRRIEESQTRLSSLREARDKFEKLASNPPQPGDWAGLEKFEKAIGPVLPAKSRDERGGGGRWLGHVHTSKDGLPILVGRDREENLELTFRHARGNDYWMHLRGRPGAHVLIPMPAGKSIPLETLLDAANLAIFYSGGEKWGKTEVDYTQKKHVKRIKDSTEASYTHNKTLIIEPDEARLKRLLGGSR